MHQDILQLQQLNLLRLQAYEESAGDSAEQSKEAFRAQVVSNITNWLFVSCMPFCKLILFNPLNAGRCVRAPPVLHALVQDIRQRGWFL